MLLHLIAYNIYQGLHVWVNIRFHNILKYQDKPQAKNGKLEKIEKERCVEI